MIKRYFSFLLLLLYINVYGNAAKDSNGSNPPVINSKDSIEKQILFNGRLWKNQFTGIEGHQFLLSPYFLPGVVTIENHIFNNVRLRYDIFTDELLIQKDAYRVIRTSWERISSFDISFNDEELHFVNFSITTSGKFKGYFHLYYDSEIKIFVRYSKEILPTSITNGLPRFEQVNSVYIFKNGEYSKVDNLRNLLTLLGDEEEQKLIKKFIRSGNFKVTAKDPSSIRRVVEYSEKIASQL